MIRDRFKLRSIVCAAIIILTPAGVSARGVSAYLPLNMSPEIERKIERVLILADKPVMTRPIAVATVADSLQTACKKDGVLCREVEQYLRRYMKGAGLTRLRAEVAIDKGESEQVLPNQYGEKADSSWEISGEAFYRSGDYLLLNLGGVAYQGYSSPTGTMLSLGMDYAQLDIGYRPHWLSPFTDSSTLLSTEAPTMPSVTLSNYKPISGLGLSYQVFLAQMSKSDHIVFQNRFTTGNPRLAGLHLQMEPASGYALSINRQMQFGGGERGQDTFMDFVNALVNPRRYDNAGSSITFDQQFGNQQASLTSRMLFPGKRPFAVYFEYAGEDTSRYKNYLLGNVSFSLGIDFPRLWDRFDFTYEATEWQNGWYVHGVYQDGLTNHGLVIGHWFGDQRQFNYDIGGISHMLRLGWQAPDGAYVRGIYRTLENGSYSINAYKRMQEVGLSYSRPWHGQLIGAELYSGQDVFGDRYARLSASIELGQSRDKDYADSISTAADADDSTDLMLDVGTAFSYIQIDRGAKQYGDSAHWISNGGNAHLGIGARRSVSDYSDLGVRVEWDRMAGHDLLSARIIDYRYRIGKRFALEGFFGVGRYDFGTPAYGWYAGVGPQLLNVFPKWDLCIDGRLHQKMVRDKVLPGDPPNRRASDSFTVLSVSAYLSRHF
jgi:hypothetical protein